MTNDENEILNITLEECAEVIQAISKVFRFGWNSCHPDKPEYDNKDHLNEEVGDLCCMIQLMIDHNMVDREAVESAALQKLEKLKKWSSIKNL